MLEFGCARCKRPIITTYRYTFGIGTEGIGQAIYLCSVCWHDVVPAAVANRLRDLAYQAHGENPPLF